jgi:hypothetical protein
MLSGEVKAGQGNSGESLPPPRRGGGYSGGKATVSEVGKCNS